VARFRKKRKGQWTVLKVAALAASVPSARPNGHAGGNRKNGKTRTHQGTQKEKRKGHDSVKTANKQDTAHFAI
jgi:hypothetical protein